MTVWPRVQARRVFRVVNGGTPTGDPDNWGGDVLWATPVDLGHVNGGILASTGRTITQQGLERGSRSVPASSLLVSTRAPIGYVVETQGEMAFNQGCRGLVLAAHGDIRFFRYQLSVMAERLNALGQGSTFVELSSEGLLAVPLVMPPLADQVAIADFLDDETARIDALIAKKRRMIELIGGRAASTASVAAWGAGNKDHTPIQAIGPVKQLPRGWRVLRNKVFLREINERSSDGSEELLSVSHLTGVTPRSEKNVTMFMAESLEGYKRVQPGDLVINTMWAWMGAAGVSQSAGIVSPAYGVYRFDRSVVLPGYYDVLIRTPEYITEMTRFSRGVWTSRLRLYPDEFLRLSAPVPPPGEQVEIVERVTAAGSIADRINTTLTRAVELLTERRQALITAAVTGELDVARHLAKAAS